MAADTAVLQSPWYLNLYFTTVSYLTENIRIMTHWFRKILVFTMKSADIFTQMRLLVEPTPIKQVFVIFHVFCQVKQVSESLFGGNQQFKNRSNFTDFDDFQAPNQFSQSEFIIRNQDTSNITHKLWSRHRQKLSCWVTLDNFSSISSFRPFLHVSGSRNSSFTNVFESMKDFAQCTMLLSRADDALPMLGCSIKDDPRSRPTYSEEY